MLSSTTGLTLTSWQFAVLTPCKQKKTDKYIYFTLYTVYILFTVYILKLSCCLDFFCRILIYSHHKLTLVVCKCLRTKDAKFSEAVSDNIYDMQPAYCKGQLNINKDFIKIYD